MRSKQDYFSVLLNAEYFTLKLNYLSTFLAAATKGKLIVDPVFYSIIVSEHGVKLSANFNVRSSLYRTEVQYWYSSCRGK